MTGADATASRPAAGAPVVFVSYAREDKPVSDALALELERVGLSVWRDTTGLRFGDTFAGKIAQAIEECPVFVVLVSKSSLKSSWVENETAFARQQKKRILPIFLESVPWSGGLALYLISLHGCEAFPPPFEERFPLIVSEVLLAARDESPERRTATTVALAPVRRAWWFLSAVLTALLMMVAWKAPWRPTESDGRGVATDAPIREVPAADSERRAGPPPGMVQIVGGSFMLGRDEGPQAERPAHQTVVSTFWLDATETNNRDYFAVVRRGKQGSDRPDHPVSDVSWKEASAYCQAVGKRLPTETEWEYAARGGERNLLFTWEGSWRDDMSRSNVGSSAPVRRYPPNVFGIYDLLGNVLEWTSSPLVAYPGGGRLDPAGKDLRVIRGGHSYCTKWGTPADLDKRYATHRTWAAVDDRDPCVGFRCAWTPAP